MSDGVEKKIARMVRRDGLSGGQANAALQLISIIVGAAAPETASGWGRAKSYLHSARCGGRGEAVNRHEQQAIFRIADRQLFERWRTEMLAGGQDPGVTVAVLVFGETFSALDQRRKRRKGWAREQVRLGIVTFHEILQQTEQETKLDKWGQREYQIG